MARNGSGIYNAPAGNPVLVGTTIQASWANTLVSDLGAEISNSLPRDGQAPMTGSLRVVDGSLVAPGLSFNSETGTGIYRPGASQIALVTSGTNALTANAGNVGIGTSTPTVKLDVRSNAADWAANVQNDGVSFNRKGLQVKGGSNTEFYGLGLTTADGSVEAHLRVAAGSIPTLGSSTAHPLVLSTSNTERLRVTAAGNVGIGTTAPIGILHVRPATNVSVAVVNASNTLRLSAVNDLVAEIPMEVKGSIFTVQTNSSERLRVDNSGNVGIGTSSPVGVGGSVGVHISGPTGGNPALRLTNGDTGSAATDGSAIFVGNAASAGTGSLNVYNYEAAPIALFTSATERMRIDASGNVGIGTSTPVSTRQLTLYSAASTAGLALRTAASGVTATDGAEFSLGSDNNLYITNREAGNTIFENNGSERMRINISGNVGVGVTPSAWDANRKAVQIGRAVALWGNSDINSAALSLNAYRSGATYYYQNDGFLSTYEQFNGAHTWFTAPSGLAGAVATLSQAMTLDASGNLGLGTTAPGAALDIANGPMARITSDTAALRLRGATTNTNYGELAIDSSGTTYLSSQTGDLFLSSQAASGQLLFRTGGGVERARINASGNLGVGTTSPNNIVHVASGVGGIASQLKLQNTNTSATAGRGSAISFSGTGDTTFAQISASTATASNSTGLLTFGTHNGTALAERMRIDQNGNVGIGLTNPSSRLEVSSGANSNGSLKVSGTATTAGNFASIAYQTGTATWSAGTEAGTGRFYVYNGAAAMDQIGISGGTNSSVTLTAAGSTAAFVVNTNGAERMRVDAGGQLGLGTNSPGYRLDVDHAGGVARFRNGTTGYGSIALGASATATQNFQISSDGSGNLIVFRGNPGSGTEQIRVDANGNLGVGGTATDYTGSGYDSIAVNGSTGGVLEFQSAGTQAARITGWNNTLSVHTNNAERLRVDSSGNLALGATSTSSRLLVQGNGSQELGTFQQGGAASAVVVVNHQDAPGTNATARPVVSLRKGGTTMFNLSCDGSSLAQGRTYYEALGEGAKHSFITNGQVLAEFVYDSFSGSYANFPGRLTKSGGEVPRTYGWFDGNGITNGNTAYGLTVPIWARKITVTVQGLSTSGTSPVLFQLGTAGGFKTSGYTGVFNTIANATATASTASTAGFVLSAGAAASTVRNGTILLTRNSTGWVYTATVSTSTGLITIGSGFLAINEGVELLSQIRFTTVNGTDTFNGAGTATVLVEGV